MLVLKFGGASLQDAKNFLNAFEWIERNSQEQLCVVVSAMMGVTNLLLESCSAAPLGKENEFEKAMQEVHRKHLELIEEILGTSKEVTIQEFEKEFQELMGMLKAMSALRECTLRARDYFVSHGERWSARILCALIQEKGLKSSWFMAQDLIRTDKQFSNAYPDYEETKELVKRTLNQEGQVWIVPGFTGATSDGETTTLGRGGTDLSASLLAYCLDAREVWFLKEVDGILSTDPRVVKEARIHSRLSYREVAEMSYFGAKVLHPVAIHPLKLKSIPARIRNVYSPEHPGTMVEAKSDDPEHPARVITSIESVCMLTVQGDGMIGVPGVAGRVFSRVAREGINVLMISQSSSEQNICMTITGSDGEKAQKALGEELELEIHKGQVQSVDLLCGVSVLSLVGEGMSGQPGVAGKLFQALGDAKINVLMIAQGSSELNISFLVYDHDRARALQVVHNQFHLES